MTKKIKNEILLNTKQLGELGAQLDKIAGFLEMQNASYEFIRPTERIDPGEIFSEYDKIYKLTDLIFDQNQEFIKGIYKAAFILMSVNEERELNELGYSFDK